MSWGLAHDVQCCCRRAKARRQRREERGDPGRADLKSPPARSILWYEEVRMGLREVSAILWRERHLLELLLFKLDEEQLVLAAGRTRWLPRATPDVEMVLQQSPQ